MKTLKKILYCLFISLPFLFTSCNTEEDDSLDKTVICSKLANTLVANDSEKVEAEIKKLIDTQGPVNGLKESFDKLIMQIESCPAMQVTDSCFGCIETNPLQSEIRIAITVNNQTHNKAIDLLHKDNRLTFFHVHD